jgi:DNA-binding response OmpR family regulator
VDFRNIQRRREGSSLVPLTPHEFKILNSMEHNTERVISRNELLNEVLGCHKSDSRRSVDNAVCADGAAVMFVLEGVVRKP